MTQELSILHAEDNPHDAELIRESLKAQGITPQVLRVESMEDFLLALEQGTYDLIISDFTMPTFDGMRALKIAKEKAPAPRSSTSPAQSAKSVPSKRSATGRSTTS